MRESSASMIKRKMRVLVLILTIALFLSGCGEWAQYFYTESHLEEIAQTTLEEEYGEKFEVRNMYTDYWKHFYATCVPVNNSEVSFTAKIGKNGNLYYDNYLECILGTEIKNRILIPIEKRWPNSFVYVQQLRVDEYSLKLEKNYDTASINDYIKYTDEPYYSNVDLYIPISSYKNIDDEDEYSFWAEDIGNMIKNGDITKMSVAVWIVDDDLISRVREFYKSKEIRMTTVVNEFGKPIYQFGYDEKNLEMISLDEYKKRKERR